MKTITYSIRKPFPKPPSVEEVEELCEELGFRIKDAPMWRAKWSRLRGGAPQRGCVCYLTIEEYLKLAKKAGLKTPEQIGVGSEKFQMSRRKDKGDYEWGNCRFLTQSENLAEKKANGGYDTTIEAHSKSFRVRSPTGRLHQGKNLREFCRKYELNQSKLSRVCRGLSSSHLGWTGVYT